MPEIDLAEYAERRHLRPATVERVLALGGESSAAVLAVAVPLAMNDNNLRDTLDLVEDIAARRHCSVAEVLGLDEVVAVLRRDLGRSDRIREIKSCLRRLRYPQLSAALERIAALRDQLRLPPGVTLELPDNLEGDELTLTLRVSSVDQLRANVAAVGRGVEGDEIESIFALWQESEG